MTAKTTIWKLFALMALCMLLASCQIPENGESFHVNETTPTPDNVSSNETGVNPVNESETSDDWMLVNVVDNQEIRYEPEILTAFESSDEVPVVVDVRHPPMPPVPDNQTLEEFKELVAEQRRLRGEKTDAVLATLPDEDTLRLAKVVTEDGFFGTVAEASFEKLMRNPDVETIYSGRGFNFSFMRESIDATEVTYVEPAVIEAFEKSNTQVSVIVRTRDTTGIHVTAAMPVKLQVRLDKIYIKVMKRKTDAILSSLPKMETKHLRGFPLEDAFSGNVTRETSEKLALHPDVTSIWLNRFIPFIPDW